MLLLAFVLVLLATGLFSVRTVRRAVYWRFHRDEPVRPWMSVPITLMLVAAGSFVALGEMEFWQVIVVASAAAVLGDQIGYALGRWGGHHVAARVNRKKAWAAQMQRAEKFARRWGGAGIFFSRWLVTPLGPWINLSSGMAAIRGRDFFAGTLLAKCFGLFCTWRWANYSATAFRLWLKYLEILPG